MKTEEEFDEYKLLFEKKYVQKARATAMVFGVLAMTALIALVYAFFQQTAANKARFDAVVQLEASQTEIKELETKLADAVRNAERQAALATRAQKRAEEDCKKSNNRK